MERYTISTNRLYLRPFLPRDAPGFFELNADPLVLQYTGDVPFTSIEAAELFIRSYDHYEKYGFGRWAMIHKKTSSFIGFCGLKYHLLTGDVDLGFRLLRAYWRQGLATESAVACLNYGFASLGLTKIIGRVRKENEASIRVLEKIGMELEGEFDFEGYPGWKYAITHP